MKHRQKKLSQILYTRFRKIDDFGNSIKSSDLEKTGLLNEVTRTYRRLGGILQNPPLSFGKWDICLDGFIVELDEEQHFNRYRASTLDSYIYHMEDGFDIFAYQKYCHEFERECLRKSSWGKYWTSPSTEKQFGSPGPKGNLVGDGSPRWRQRAFYDYLRDLFATIYNIPLIRISIYEKLNLNNQELSIGELLEVTNATMIEEIVKFIENKTNNIL